MKKPKSIKQKKPLVFLIEIFVQHPLATVSIFVLGFLGVSSGGRLEAQETPFMSSHCTRTASPEATRRPTAKIFRKYSQQLQRAMLLGIGQVGYSGVGKETVRLPNTVVTSSVNPLIPTEANFTSVEAMVSDQATRFEQHALYKIFFQSSEFLTPSSLRIFLEDLSFKSNSCFQQLTEIKVFCFSQKSHVIFVPKLIHIENRLMDAAQRLKVVSTSFSLGNIHLQPIHWVKQQNLEIKNLYTVFEKAFQELYHVRFEVSLVNFKKTITVGVRLIPLQQIHGGLVPNFEGIQYSNGTESLLDDSEEKPFLTLFLDNLQRGFCEFYWRVSSPGSFYQSTPFYWCMSHNSTLETRTMSERKRLLDQDLTRTLFAHFCSTPKKMVEFYQTAGFFSHAMTRALYQNQFQVNVGAAIAVYQANQALAATANALVTALPAATAEPILHSEELLLPSTGVQEQAVGGSAAGSVFFTPRTQGAMVLTNLRHADADHARRSLGWSHEPAEVVVPQPNGQLLLANYAHETGPGHQGAQQPLEEALAPEADHPDLGAGAGARGGDLATSHKRNLGEFDSFEDPDRFQVKRLKTAQEADHPDLGADAGARGGSFDTSHKRTRGEFSSSDDSDGLPVKHLRK